MEEAHSREGTGPRLVGGGSGEDVLTRRFRARDGSRAPVLDERPRFRQLLVHDAQGEEAEVAHLDEARGEQMPCCPGWRRAALEVAPAPRRRGSVDERSVVPARGLVVGAAAVVVTAEAVAPTTSAMSRRSLAWSRHTLHCKQPTDLEGSPRVSNRSSRLGVLDSTEETGMTPAPSYNPTMQCDRSHEMSTSGTPAEAARSR